MRKKDASRILGLIESLALDCSEHLQKQHNQKDPNDKPRFYFDNIAKQTRELRQEMEGSG